MTMRSEAAVHVVMCRVTPEDRMPDGVDLFLGTAVQHRLGAKVDVKNDRMELWDDNIVVDLEPVSKLRKRMRQRPQDVIEICSGMSGARAVMEDPGYNIGHWLAVENNSRVATAVPYNDVVHSRQADVMKHSAESLVAELGARPNLCFAGPNC